MKNAAFVMSATLVLLMGSQNCLFSQKIATWKGGTPGNVHAWNCASNWKEGRVPNEFSDVVIANDQGQSGNYTPMITCAAGQVNSLTITPGSSLDIATTGSLVVLDRAEIGDNTYILNAGMLVLPDNGHQAAATRAVVSSTK